MTTDASSKSRQILWSHHCRRSMCQKCSPGGSSNRDLFWSIFSLPFLSASACFCLRGWGSLCPRRAHSQHSRAGSASQAASTRRFNFRFWSNPSREVQVLLFTPSQQGRSSLFALLASPVLTPYGTRYQRKSRRVLRSSNKTKEFSSLISMVFML